jgi:predicted metal-dependent peptidase
MPSDQQKPDQGTKPMTKLHDKISKGRTQIILRDPFFATILMDMNPIIDDSKTESCGTDGEQIIYNSSWLETADSELIAAAMRKMALHVALAHHLRRRSREPKKWQAACDQAALHVMQQDGVRTPEGATPSPLFAGLTAEEIYKQLDDQDSDKDQDKSQQDQSGGQGQGQGQDQGDGQGQSPSGGHAAGHAMDSGAKDQSELKQKERENDQRIMRAAMAEKAAGKESASAKRLADEVKSRGPDWREKLHAFVDNSVESDFAWSRPNRRFIHDDIYLPGQVADGLSTLGFIIDTSGSIDDKTLGVFFGQINAAREAIGIERVVVIYCDAKVKRIDEFGHGEEVIKRPVGGGGTDMAPAFEAIRAYDPNTVVCLTDGIFWEPLTADPAAPTLFCVYGGQDSAPATFGESIKLPPAA